MEFLTTLWLPILASAVIVFVASSIIWMALPIHKNDYKNPGDKEEAILSFIRSSGLAPGLYHVPWCGHSGKPDAATMEKMKRGPWAQINVFPAMHNMGKMLGMWFLHIVIVSIFVAYITSHSLAVGTPYLKVFQIAGAVAFMAYGGYSLPLSIWHGMPWSQLPGRLFDGIVYALLTAGTFAWLWPKVAIALPV